MNQLVLGVIGAWVLFRCRKNESKAVKQLYNNPIDVVQEAVDVSVKIYPHLARLDGFPAGIQVIFRKVWDRCSTAKVALVSGGGSGHEPAHTGFIGEGMLTAVVAGSVFASPSVEAVLAAIRTVGRPSTANNPSPGVLLIVKNYTGDRINFGVAAEKAKAEGIPVEMVIVADDCALPLSKGITGGRGVAGTVFVHKAAGAAAEEGLSLAEVTRVGRAAAQSVRSLGASLSSCAAPGHHAEERIPDGFFELGLGIHGEPGLHTLPFTTMHSMIDLMIDHMIVPDNDRDNLPLRRGDRVCLLVNNLGTSTPLEIGCIAHKALAVLDEKGVIVECTQAGSFMTSLDMKGFSLSIVKVDQMLLQRIQRPTEAPAWDSAACAPHGPCDLSIQPLPKASRERTQSAHTVLSETGRMMRQALERVCTDLIAREPELTRWDTKVGDGDCGFTFKQGAERILKDLDDYPLNDSVLTLQALASSVSHSMGGTSGGLYELMFSAAQSSMIGLQDPSPQAWATAGEAAVRAVMQYGGAKAGYRTMLDSLIPASKAFSDSVTAGKSTKSALSAAADAADAGANATKAMMALAGRSNYVPAHLLKGTPDPGAVAVAVWMRALFESLG